MSAWAQRLLLHKDALWVMVSHGDVKSDVTLIAQVLSVLHSDDGHSNDHVNPILELLTLLAPKSCPDLLRHVFVKIFESEESASGNYLYERFLHQYTLAQCLSSEEESARIAGIYWSELYTSFESIHTNLILQNDGRLLVIFAVAQMLLPSAGIPPEIRRTQWSSIRHGQYSSSNSSFGCLVLDLAVRVAVCSWDDETTDTIPAQVLERIRTPPWMQSDKGSTTYVANVLTSESQKIDLVPPILLDEALQLWYHPASNSTLSELESLYNIIVKLGGFGSPPATAPDIRSLLPHVHVLDDAVVTSTLQSHPITPSWLAFAYLCTNQNRAKDVVQSRCREVAQYMLSLYVPSSGQLTQETRDFVELLVDAGLPLKEVLRVFFSVTSAPIEESGDSLWSVAGSLATTTSTNPIVMANASADNKQLSLALFILRCDFPINRAYVPEGLRGFYTLSTQTPPPTVEILGHAFRRLCEEQSKTPNGNTFQLLCLLCDSIKIRVYEQQAAVETGDSIATVFTGFDAHAFGSCIATCVCVYVADSDPQLNSADDLIGAITSVVERLELHLVPELYGALFRKIPELMTVVTLTKLLLRTASAGQTTRLIMMLADLDTEFCTFVTDLCDTLAPEAMSHGELFTSLNTLRMKLAQAESLLGENSSSSSSSILQFYARSLRGVRQTPVHMKNASIVLQNLLGSLTFENANASAGAAFISSLQAAVKRRVNQDVSYFESCYPSGIVTQKAPWYTPCMGSYVQACTCSMFGSTPTKQHAYICYSCGGKTYCNRCAGSHARHDMVYLGVEVVTCSSKDSSKEIQSDPFSRGGLDPHVLSLLGTQKSMRDILQGSSSGNPYTELSSQIMCTKEMFKDLLPSLRHVFRITSNEGEDLLGPSRPIGNIQEYRVTTRTLLDKGSQFDLFNQDSDRDRERELLGGTGLGLASHLTATVNFLSELSSSPTPITTALLASSMCGYLATYDGTNVLLLEDGHALNLFQTSRNKRDASDLNVLWKHRLGFKARGLRFNQLNGCYLAVYGAQDLMVLWISGGSVVRVVAPQLGLTSNILSVSWLPNSHTELCVVTANFVKVFDTSEDVYCPSHNYEPPSSEEPLSCAAVIPLPNGRLYLVASTKKSTYCLSITPMDCVDGPIPLKQNLTGIDGEVQSMFYHATMEVLMVSFANKPIALVIFDAAPESSASSGPLILRRIVIASAANTKPLHSLTSWSDCPDVPGLITGYATRSNVLNLVFVQPDANGIFIQMMDDNGSNKVVGCTVLRRSADSLESAGRVAVLLDNGSLHVTPLSLTAAPPQNGCLPTNVVCCIESQRGSTLNVKPVPFRTRGAWAARLVGDEQAQTPSRYAAMTSSSSVAPSKRLFPQCLLSALNAPDEEGPKSPTRSPPVFNLFENSEVHTVNIPNDITMEDRRPANASNGILTISQRGTVMSLKVPSGKVVVGVRLRAQCSKGTSMRSNGGRLTVTQDSLQAPRWYSIFPTSEQPNSATLEVDLGSNVEVTIHSIVLHCTTAPERSIGGGSGFGGSSGAPSPYGDTRSEILRRTLANSASPALPAGAGRGGNIELMNRFLTHHSTTTRPAIPGMGGSHNYYPPPPVYPSRSTTSSASPERRPPTTSTSQGATTSTTKATPLNITLGALQVLVGCLACQGGKSSDILKMEDADELIDILYSLLIKTLHVTCNHRTLTSDVRDMLKQRVEAINAALLLLSSYDFDRFISQRKQALSKMALILPVDDLYLKTLLPFTVSTVFPRVNDVLDVCARDTALSVRMVESLMTLTEPPSSAVVMHCLLSSPSTFLSPRILPSLNIALRCVLTPQSVQDPVTHATLRNLAEEYLNRVVEMVSNTTNTLMVSDLELAFNCIVHCAWYVPSAIPHAIQKLLPALTVESITKIMKDPNESSPGTLLLQTLATLCGMDITTPALQIPEASRFVRSVPSGRLEISLAPEVHEVMLSLFAPMMTTLLRKSAEGAAPAATTVELLLEKSPVDVVLPIPLDSCASLCAVAGCASLLDRCWGTPVVSSKTHSANLAVLSLMQIVSCTKTTVEQRQQWTQQILSIIEQQQEQQVDSQLLKFLTRIHHDSEDVARALLDATVLTSCLNSIQSSAAASNATTSSQSNGELTLFQTLQNMWKIIDARPRSWTSYLQDHKEAGACIVELLQRGDLRAESKMLCFNVLQSTPIVEVDDRVLHDMVQTLIQTPTTAVGGDYYTQLAVTLVALARKSNQNSSLLLKEILQLLNTHVLHGNAVRVCSTVLKELVSTTAQCRQEVTRVVLSLFNEIGKVQHPRTAVYAKLGELAGLHEVFTLEPCCLRCDNIDPPTSDISLRDASEMKYGTEEIFARLKSPILLHKVNVNFTDVKGTKFPQEYSVWYSSQPTSDVVDLKKPTFVWTYLGSRTMEKQQQGTHVFVASLPIVAANLRIVFSGFKAASETLACPTCGAEVTSRTGQCSRCDFESAFQCSQCRNINHDCLDAFFCNTCGASRYVKYETSMTVSSVLPGCEAIHDEAHYASVQQQLSLESAKQEDRMHQFRDITTTVMTMLGTASSPYRQEGLEAGRCIAALQTLVNNAQTQQAVLRKSALQQTALMRNIARYLDCGIITKNVVDDSCEKLTQTTVASLSSPLLSSPTLSHSAFSSSLSTTCFGCYYAAQCGFVSLLTKLCEVDADSVLCIQRHFEEHLPCFNRVVEAATQRSLKQLSNTAKTLLLRTMKGSRVLSVHLTLLTATSLKRQTSSVTNIFLDTCNIQDSVWPYRYAGGTAILANVLEKKSPSLDTHAAVIPLLEYFADVMVMGRVKWRSAVTRKAYERIVSWWIQYDGHHALGPVLIQLLTRTANTSPTHHFNLLDIILRVPLDTWSNVDGYFGMMKTLLKPTWARAYAIRKKYLITVTTALELAVRQYSSSIEHGDLQTTDAAVPSINHKATLLALFLSESGTKDIPHRTMRNKYCSHPASIVQLLNASLTLQQCSTVWNVHLNTANKHVQAMVQFVLTDTLTDRRRLLSAYVDQLQQLDSLRGISVLVKDLVNVLNPAPPKATCSLNFKKQPTQEDFIRGRITKVYQSSEIGTTFRDCNARICKELELDLDPEFGLELLVDDIIIGPDVPIVLVYSEVWKKSARQHQEGSPMVVVYRLQGLDGEATEERIDSLKEPPKAVVDPEEKYAVLNMMCEEGGRGVSTVTRCLSHVLTVQSSRQLLGARQTTAATVLELLETTLKLSSNRAMFTSLEQHTTLLQCCIRVCEVDNGPVATTVVPRILNVVRNTLLSSSGPAGDPEKVKVDVMRVLQLYAQHHVVSAPQLLVPLSRPYSEVLDEVVRFFIPMLRKYLSSDPKEVTSTFGTVSHTCRDPTRWTEAFTEMLRPHGGGGECGVDLNALAIQASCLRLDVVKDLLNHLDTTEGTPANVVTLRWCVRTLNTIIQNLPDMTITDSVLQKLHVWERMQAQKELAEDVQTLLTTLRKSSETLNDRIDTLRRKSKLEMSEKAKKKREEMLLKLKMTAKSDGVGNTWVRTNSDVETRKIISKVQEEEGLKCIICKEGALLAPNNLLCLYVHVTTPEVSTYTSQPDLCTTPLPDISRQATPCTTTHFTCIHYLCHRKATSKGNEEWQAATLHNTKTLCNAMYPAVTSGVDPDQITEVVSKYWSIVPRRGQLSKIEHVLYDMRMLLSRLVFGHPYGRESQGGGPEHNFSLLPFMVWMGLHVMSTDPTSSGGVQKRLTAALHRMIEDDGRACVSGSSPPPCPEYLHMLSVFSLFVWNKEQWRTHRAAVLRALLGGVVRCRAATPCPLLYGRLLPSVPVPGAAPASSSASDLLSRLDALQQLGLHDADDMDDALMHLTEDDLRALGMVRSTRTSAAQKIEPVPGTDTLPLPEYVMPHIQFVATLDCLHDAFVSPPTPTSLLTSIPANPTMFVHRCQDVLREVQATVLPVGKGGEGLREALKWFNLVDVWCPSGKEEKFLESLGKDA